MSLITCDNMAVGYGDELVCEGISFSVEQGDYLCIVGENGSGKSTLLKTILGLLPPISGTVTVAEVLKAGQIGYLPQTTAIREDFPATVHEIVLSGMLPSMGRRPFYGKKEKANAVASMERFGIAAIADRNFTKLSGGQKQRVLLARTLAYPKRLLVLDEPTVGLDIVASEELYSLVEDLNASGQTIMMVSHDAAAVEKYANKIVKLTDGGFREEDLR
ncbi:MAG: ABC transporter ATP-binding protein [Lachnospiraceae bacterium]|nr:ABC transporter ATP-binding protein [Lachnospiraceae bacterium]